MSQGGNQWAEMSIGSKSNISPRLGLHSAVRFSNTTTLILERTVRVLMNDTGYSTVHAFSAHYHDTPVPLGPSHNHLLQTKKNYFTYPWDGLEDFLARESAGVLRLVGYGSLMNVSSASKTLKTQGVRRHPVIAYGARRIFNYVIGNELLERYGASPDASQCAALNVLSSPDLGDTLNGILFEVPLEELPALRARESDYDLFPVICRDWHRPANDPILAFILSVPDTSSSQRTTSNGDLFPHPGYLKVCHHGAQSISGAFFDYFLDSTYLADRKTKLRHWLDAHPSPCRPGLVG